MRQDGDPNDAERRLTEWVRRYADPLRGYLWSLAPEPDRSSVEDLLQEVFLRAWRARADYVELGREKAYLFRIADRILADRRRTAARRFEDAADLDQTPDPSAPTPVDWLAEGETRRLAVQALEALSDPQRRTLLLRYFGELRFEEIAEILGCPLNTALSHARRGLERLRAILVREAEP